MAQEREFILSVNQEEVGEMQKIRERVFGFVVRMVLGRSIADIRAENIRLRSETEQYRRAAEESYRHGAAAVMRADSERRFQERAFEALHASFKELSVEAGHLRNLAHNDPLTGLLNRRGATEHLAGMASALWHAAKQDGEPMFKKALPCSVVYVDLDNFKPVNDSFGHGKGDAILCGVAELLGKTFSRKADLVARVGGDEFVVIMTHADMEGAAKQAEHLLAGLASDPQFRVADDLRVGASIGVASMTLRPEVGGLSSDAVTASLDATIKCADRAMYAAKQSGKGRVSIYRC